MKYRVLRQHQGDRPYRIGDERTMREEDARSLVKFGVLEPIREKKAPESDNKMQDEPSNKAEKKSRKAKSEDS